MLQSDLLDMQFSEIVAYTSRYFSCAIAIVLLKPLCSTATSQLQHSTAYLEKWRLFSKVLVKFALWKSQHFLEFTIFLPDVPLKSFVETNEAILVNKEDYGFQNLIVSCLPSDIIKVLQEHLDVI